MGRRILAGLLVWGAFVGFGSGFFSMARMAVQGHGGHHHHAPCNK